MNNTDTRQVKCEHCDDTGTRYPCREGEMQRIKLLHSWPSESLGIYQCRRCARMWMIRHQFDPGTGRDDIWLRVGETKRGYAFSAEEAAAALREFREFEEARQTRPLPPATSSYTFQPLGPCKRLNTKPADCEGCARATNSIARHIAAAIEREQGASTEQLCVCGDPKGYHVHGENGRQCRVLCGCKAFQPHLCSWRDKKVIETKVFVVGLALLWLVYP